MKSILMVVTVLFILTGCTEPLYHEDQDVSKQVLKKYSEKLKKAKVKFLKCYPEKDGNMRAVYTTHNRDNSFPATIRFDYLNKSYNVYFDKAYLNSPKKELLKDIDTCFSKWEKLKDAKKTWK